MYKYPTMSKTLGSFKLNVECGSFTNNEIIVLLGENGSGKTTLIRLLTGDPKMQPEEKEFEVKFKVKSGTRARCQLQTSNNRSKIPRNSSRITSR